MKEQQEHMQTQNSQKPILDKDALFDVIRKVRKNKRRFFINGAVGCFVGLVFALSVVKTYTSEIVLAPEMVDGSIGGSGGLSSLASMAGINLGASSTDAIYPELYPQIISSTPFAVDLLKTHVVSIDKEVNTDLYEYISENQKIGFADIPLAWMKAATASLVKKFSKEPELPAQADTLNPFCLTKNQQKVVDFVRFSLVSAVVNKKDQIITISVTSQDPLISANLADTVRVKLQDAITDYRTKKARLDMLYSENLMNEAKQEYIACKERYVAYADAHKDAYMESVKTEMSDLENEMSLAFSTYTQLVQQYNTAKAKVQERTPSFTVIQPASISIKPSSTPKLYVLFEWIFLSQFLTFLWLLCKDKVAEWRLKLRNESN